MNERRNSSGLQKLNSDSKDQGKKTFEFDIAGLPYRLRSSHDDQTVNELVAFVNDKMRQAMAATKSGSFQSAAVLAALNIAEELILLKKRALNELDELEDRALRMSQDLENFKVSKTGLDL